MVPDAHAWWQRFFDGDNRLRWLALSNHEDPWSVHVLPWIELAQDDDVNLPIVLPRLDAHDQPSWYCAGRSDRGALRLREALQAFIGPSYSDFDGGAYMLNAEDPVEAAFAEDTVAPVYRVRPLRPADVGKIQRVLELYRSLLRRMPKREESVQRPLGVLRAELDRAVAAGDESGARSLLGRIRRIGRLDAENLLFVEVGIRAGLGQWRDIAEDGQLLNQLIGLRLPPRVLSDVHEALYRHHVEPSEDTSNPDGALVAFRAAGLARRSALYGTRRGVRSARVLKAFFLYELARQDGDHSLLANLAGELEQLNDPFASVLARLRPTTNPQPADYPMRAADEAFDELEIDRALEFYLQAPPSRKRLSRLVRCAEDVGTIEVAMRVLDAINSEEDVENLPTPWVGRLRALEQMCEGEPNGQPPQGWLDWARRVEAGMDEDLAMTSLREHVSTWESDKLAQHHGRAAELARIINNASGSADTLFREAAPLLFQTLTPESGEPPRQAKPLLQILVTKVAFFGDPSQNELQLARDLAATLLVMGLNENEYAGLISDLEDLMGAQMSIFTLDWALDLVELLAVHACPDPERRLRLVLLVIQKAQRFAHRLSPSDALVTKQLCEDYDIDCPVEVATTEGTETVRTGEALSGKKVAIYTLMEAAGQRAADLLKRLCPTVRVELNGDHECTKRLIDLARTSDLFVFAWKSSKHQAFYCIKDHRDNANPLIQAQGKGTSSILRAVLENA